MCCWVCVLPCPFGLLHVLVCEFSYVYWWLLRASLWFCVPACTCYRTCDYVCLHVLVSVGTIEENTLTQPELMSLVGTNSRLGPWFNCNSFKLLRSLLIPIFIFTFGLFFVIFFVFLFLFPSSQVRGTACCTIYYSPIVLLRLFLKHINGFDIFCDISAEHTGTIEWSGWLLFFILFDYIIIFFLLLFEQLQSPLSFFFYKKDKPLNNKMSGRMTTFLADTFITNNIF